MRRLHAFVYLLACGLGCKAGSAAGLIEPKQQSASATMQELACTEVPSRGTPLVVDWPSHAKTDLEEAMRDGLAVVKYDCERIELLTECRIAGSYGFMGSNLKQDLITFQGAGELHANIPLSKVTLGGEVSRNSAVNLGLLQIGKFRTPLRDAAPAQVTGPSDECAGATHFVRGAYVGAFAMRNATSARVATAVELFKVGVGASSESAHDVVRTDGDPTKCEAADRSAPRPPEGCGSVLRLELRALRSDVTQADAPEDVDFVDCPEGLVEIAGKCTAPSDAPHVCASDDAEGCRLQCDRGNSQSCGRLAFMAHYGRNGVAQDLRAAATSYRRACDGGDHFGCAGYGVLLFNGIGGVDPDPMRAQQLQRSACDAGEPRGCNNLAYLTDLRGAHAEAHALYERSCAGGWTAACSNLGTYHERGVVVPLDLTKANAQYELGCTLGDGGGCTNLANAYHVGRGVARDPALAQTLYEKGCKLGSGVGCWYRGTARESSEPEAAASDLRRGCVFGEARACRELARFIESGGVGEIAGETTAGLEALACQFSPTCGNEAIAMADRTGEGKMAGDSPEATSVMSEENARHAAMQRAADQSMMHEAEDEGARARAEEEARIAALEREAEQHQHTNVDPPGGEAGPGDGREGETRMSSTQSPGAAHCSMSAIPGPGHALALLVLGLVRRRRLASTPR